MKQTNKQIWYCDANLFNLKPRKEETTNTNQSLSEYQNKEQQVHKKCQEIWIHIMILLKFKLDI